MYCDCIASNYLLLLYYSILSNTCNNITQKPFFLLITTIISYLNHVFSGNNNRGNKQIFLLQLQSVIESDRMDSWIC